MIKRTSVLCFFYWSCIGFIATTSHADYRTAEAAYKAGDYKTALSEATSSAAQGDPAAQSLLCMMYARGHGVEIDFAKAIPLCRLAAEQGDAVGAYGLGMAHRNGDMVEKDQAQAAKWFKIAAEKGHARSAFFLGLAYAQGWGISPNRPEGYKWLNRARLADDPEAIAFFRKILDGLGQQQSIHYSGGFGDAVETAVIIEGVKNSLEGVQAENLFMQILYPGWQKRGQNLITQPTAAFDRIELVNAETETRYVFFQVTPWMGFGNK